MTGIRESISRRLQALDSLVDAEHAVEELVTCGQGAVVAMLF